MNCFIKGSLWQVLSIVKRSLDRCRLTGEDLSFRPGIELNEPDSQCQVEAVRRPSASEAERVFR